MAKTQHKYRLTERRAADREAMAVLVEALAARFGWEHERDDHMCDGKQLWIALSGPRGLSVTIDFDGRSWTPDNYCLAWHISYKDKSDAQLSDNFARYQAGPDYFHGSHHRKKCTAFAAGIDTLLDKLQIAMEMANGGSVYGGAFL
jgi:hypothetical protein